MKTILTFIFCVTFAIVTNAQTGDRGKDLGKGMGNKYVKGYSENACVCVIYKNGDRLAVEQYGVKTNSAIKLASTTVTPAGILKKDGGAERVLVDGNCVSEKGTITMLVK